MVDTYEQNLGQKSSLTVNDYIRVVGSDNASYKQLVNDVAKKIIENYTGSSLAGSSQSVKSALDALNRKTEGIAQTYRWNNVSRLDIQLSAVPSSNKYGQLILLNSNQRVLAFIDIDDAPSVLPISGGITFTVTVSGTTLSVVASSTLWGATLGILQF